MRSIDENTVLVAQDIELIKMLENEYGFNVIVISFRDWYRLVVDYIVNH